MSMIIDVSYNKFKLFRNNGFGFYWTETPNNFVLAKNDSGIIVRCFIEKANDDKNNTIRKGLTEMGVYVRRIVFSDGKVVGINVEAVKEEKTPDARVSHGGISEKTKIKKIEAESVEAPKNVIVGGKYFSKEVKVEEEKAVKKLKENKVINATR
jgi:hypothetical protein